MTTEVTIKNTSRDKRHRIVVNEWQRNSGKDPEGVNVGRHSLAVGEEVTITIWGDHRGVTVLEEADST